jgi:uncharacterized LabA/DUF88 family protein
MLKAMVFIDFENFDIAKYVYYKKQTNPTTNPRLDFNKLPLEVVKKLTQPHSLIKTFLFAPKPDIFLMSDKMKASKYKWIHGMKNQDYFTVVEGTHSARPVAGFTYQNMDIQNPASYYVVEKGTDINLAAHLLTKAFNNSYDTAVIMSGDTDYIPVMDILNTMGKSVVVAGIHGQNLSQFQHHSDQQILLDDAFFQTCLR